MSSRQILNEVPNVQRPTDISDAQGNLVGEHFSLHVDNVSMSETKDYAQRYFFAEV